MRSGKEANRRSVFLNVPFDKGYEPLFVALISALVSIGRVPHCVLELAEEGDGRLVRIFRLIRSCPVSMHDLSRVGLPVRFNMPFELGIAVALNRMGEDHKFFMLESKRYRLQKTLSDTNGIDPGIHEATTKGIITCALAHLGKPHGNPDVKTIIRIQRQLWKTVAPLKTIHGRTSIFSRPIFSVLVDGATSLAEKEGLISA
jgi:hypothetical protein